MENLKEILDEYLQDDENLLLAEGFDDSFIGISDNNFAKPVAIYDIKICVESLIKEGMSYDEAVEYFEFNVKGAYVGEQTPLFIRNLNDIKNVRI